MVEPKSRLQNQSLNVSPSSNTNLKDYLLAIIFLRLMGLRPTFCKDECLELIESLPLYLPEQRLHLKAAFKKALKRT